MAANKSSNGDVGGKSAPKSLHVFMMKWAMQTYSFADVEIPPEDLKQLSGGVKENLDFRSDGKAYHISLKYFFPALPKKANEKAKPLTNDQKIQNKIYMTQMRRFWREAKEELQHRVDEFVARMEQQALKSESSNQSTSGQSLSSIRTRLEMQALNKMGLTQLKLWVEEDEDARLKEENDNNLMKRKDNKKEHEEWVKSKDR